MTNRKLGSIAGGTFVICVTLFLLRFYNIVTTRGVAYPFCNGIFMLMSGLVMIASVALVARCIYNGTRRFTIGLRWVVSTISSVILFGVEACVFLVGCLGMNFMGQ